MDTGSSAPPRRWLGLAVIATAQFMVIMDTSIIGVALPDMQRALDFSADGLTWVFNAYVVAFGGLLLLGGKLSDLFGARRIFVTGWAVLAAGSIVAGVASNPATELVGRAVQGAGSALIAPAALTLLMMLFAPRPAELTKALAVYGAAAPAGGTAGVFLGGVLTQYASWAWVFFINLPIAALVLALTAGSLPGAAMGARARVDVLGAITVTAGLAVSVYAVVSAPDAGWGAARTWLLLAAAAALLIAFVALQAIRRDPLVRLAIFTAPNLGAANLAQALLGAAWIPMWFFLNLYLQQVLELSAFLSGAALLPMTGLIMLGMVVLAPRVMAKLGPKTPLVAGLLTLAAGLLWLSRIDANGTYAVDVLPASLVAALGMALAFIPSLGTAISAARPEEGGLASGLVSTSYQVGSALGLAIATAIAAAAGTSKTGDVVAASHGYSAAFLLAAVTALIGAGATLVLMRTPRPMPADSFDAPAEEDAASQAHS
jgi:EmrB/QacA subfamily drug resistance transporter